MLQEIIQSHQTKSGLLKANVKSYKHLDSNESGESLKYKNSSFSDIFSIKMVDKFGKKTLQVVKNKPESKHSRLKSSEFRNIKVAYQTVDLKKYFHAPELSSIHYKEFSECEVIFEDCNFV
jgi:hypothetical protein